MLGGCSELQAPLGPDSPRTMGGGVPIRAPGLWEKGPPQSPWDCGGSSQNPEDCGGSPSEPPGLWREGPLRAPQDCGWVLSEPLGLWGGPLRAPQDCGGTPTPGGMERVDLRPAFMSKIF